MNPFAISGLLNFISFTILGFFVFFKNPKKIVNKSYFLFSLSVAFWSFGYWQWQIAIEKTEALFWTRFLTAGAILIPVFYFYFVLAFLGLLQDKKKKKILKIGFVLSSIFFILNFTPLLVKDVVHKLFFRFWPEPGFVYPFFKITFFVFVGYAFFLLYISLKKSAKFRHNQITYVLLGSILGFSGGSTNFPLWYDIPLLPYGNFAVLMFFWAVAYAVVRYRFMDISVVFKKTVAYSLSAGVLTGLFVVLVLTVTNLFSAFADVSSFAISIFCAVLIAILFNPLRNKIQSLIDRIFYKKSYDYYAIIQQVSSTLAPMFELEKIFQFSGNVIYEAMGLKSVYLLAAKPEGAYEVVYEISLKKDKSRKKDVPVKEEKIKISEYAGVIKFLKSSDDILIKDELPGYEKLLGMETIEQIKKELEVFHGEAVVPVFIDNKVSLLLILGGKISGDMFTDEDINLLKTISQQTAIAVKTARLYSEKVRVERLASIGMMSASFAHEIKNPLTSIKTFAQLIPEKYTDVDFRENFSKIVINSVHRIDRLITDLLDYSSDRMFMGVSSLNITDVVDRTLNEVKTTLELEKKNISFEKNYKKVKIDILGDESKLRQALVNIITNGCQAIPNDRTGILKVDIYPNKENVSISVTDNGEGISSENMPRMFEPFFSTKTIGVGLGLAITKKIIENHNGRICVESKLKEGTTFTMILPMQNHGK
ncbi:MAG: hypothetical protein HY806_07340 [Nitrospirae bacterium]|nr:hypothetical protein [Nitrospirota bacterium]